MPLKEKHFQIAGLLGFIVSGLIFLVPAIINKDVFSIAGIIVWILACITWLIPILKPGENTNSSRNNQR